MTDTTDTNDQPKFRNLAPELRGRILADGDATGVFVSDHVVQVLMGVPGGAIPAERARHASGVLVAVSDRLCLITAKHVLDGYRKRRELDDRVIFQAGHVSFDPEPRVLHESSDHDLVALGMNFSDQDHIEARVWSPSQWPPVAPQVGEFIAFAGLPVDHRINDGETVDLAIVGGILRVVGSDGRNFKVHMNRNDLIATRGPGIPPPGSHLGGMSGGPVFRFVPGGAVELCGVITDYGPGLDLFLMAPLSQIVIPSTNVQGHRSDKSLGDGPLSLSLGHRQEQ